MRLLRTGCLKRKDLHPEEARPRAVSRRDNTHGALTRRPERPRPPLRRRHRGPRQGMTLDIERDYLGMRTAPRSSTSRGPTSCRDLHRPPICSRLRPDPDQPFGGFRRSRWRIRAAGHAYELNKTAPAWARDTVAEFTAAATASSSARSVQHQVAVARAISIIRRWKTRWPSRQRPARRRRRRRAGRNQPGPVADQAA